MELTFEPQAEPFKIEVGYFYTIRQIKQEIEKHKGIPVSMQTLIFKGETLPDDGYIQKLVLLHDPHVQLLIAADFFKNLPVNTEEFSPAPSTVKLRVNVKTPSSSIHTLEMDANDTVLKLKERIQEFQHVPMNNSPVVRLFGKELQDNQMLLDCKIFEHFVFYVTLRSLPVPEPVKGIGNILGTPSSIIHTLQMDADDAILKLKERIQEIEREPMKGIGNTNDGGAGGSRTLRVIVLSICGKMIPMEVNPSDKVGELRKELQRLNQGGQLLLPSEYFFMRGDYLLDEDQSFLWYQVAQGETIRMIKGWVIDGRSR